MRHGAVGGAQITDPGVEVLGLQVVSNLGSPTGQVLANKVHHVGTVIGLHHAGVAALAMEHSSDSSKYTGGLYTEVYHDQMVTTFNDWCFDPARQTGDTGIIHNESTGYHVMYFVGYDQPYWEIQVSADLVNDAVDTFYEEKTEGYTAEQSSFGMSFVG